MFRWVRRFGKRKGRVAEEVVRLPGYRACPDDIRRRLHEIDPTAECVDVGRGYWILGAIRWNRPSCQAAQEAITREYGVPVSGPAGYESEDPDEELSRNRTDRVELLRLTVRYGFRPIAMYECAEPDHGLIEDFRVRDWNYKWRMRQTFLDRAMESDDEPGLRRRQAIMLEGIQDYIPNISRHMRGMKGKLGLHPGVPWKVAS
jgi:hypothetical protein